MSRFRPNSDISRLNHLTAGESARVGEAALECLLIARHFYDLTDGAFDVAIGTGLPSLEIDAERFLIRATADGVRVDLGGIGKGYAVDLVAELLEEWGLDRAFVHGGFSSAVALEPPAGCDGWPLTLSDPARAVAGPLPALDASDRAQRVRRPQGRPHPGSAHGRAGARAARGVGRAAAAWRRAAPAGPAGLRLAPAAVADALTTAFMVLRVDESEALCARSPGLEAWLLPDGASPGTADLLHFGGPAIVPAVDARGIRDSGP